MASWVPKGIPGDACPMRKASRFTPRLPRSHFGPSNESLSTTFGISMAPRLVGLLLILGSNPTTVMAQSEDKLAEPSGAPFITHRAVEDRSLDLMLDHQALIESEGDHTSAAPVGSVRAAKDDPPRADWSRRVDDGWDLEPVLLNRRQAGKPIRPDDDQSDKLLGIELRKKF